MKQLNYQMDKPLRGRVNYWTACLEDESDSTGYLKIHPAQALKTGVAAGVSGRVELRVRVTLKFIIGLCTSWK